MLNLFGGGDKEAGPAQDLRVVTLIDRGVQEARTLNKEPEVQADLYLTLGGMYEKLGKFDRADSLIESARKIRASITGQDSVETAETLVALSLLRRIRASILKRSAWRARPLRSKISVSRVTAPFEREPPQRWGTPCRVPANTTKLLRRSKKLYEFSRRQAER